MILPSSQIKNLPVFTKSEIKLGIIVDLELDTDSQSILRYVVQRGQILGRLQEPLLIHRSQVLFLTNEKMIVEDNVGEEEKEKKESVPMYESTAPNY
ncbi:MAG: PRC-barrel domain-containing protein [Candidatus Magasanikbacteria bacterium]|nr:PRC-barrel domain-containing protein [Candidatus Magasanikbacteria bacterium]